MCYSNGKFHLSKLSEDTYILDSLVKKRKNIYIYSTKLYEIRNKIKI